MINTAKQLKYLAFGFTISSDIELSELPQITINCDCDISIMNKDLRSTWDQLGNDSSYFVIEPQFMLFRVPDVAIFQVKNGNAISYLPLKEQVSDYLRLYLLGTCMGALLMQRKILPLHGSALAVNGEAIAVIGDSGAGKSTLATALINKGFELISDDVIPVTLNEFQIPIVTPAYPQQKLWQESLTNFGLDNEGLRPIVDRETKFAVPVTNNFCKDKLPLTRIFELTKTNSDEVKVQPIHNLQRFQTLFYHTYRNLFLNPFGLTEWHFQFCAAMLNKVELYELQRPTSRFTAEQLTSIILSKTSKEEANDY